MNLYDSIAKVEPEHHITRTETVPDKTPPVTTNPTPIDVHTKKSSPRRSKGKSITSVNKRKEIYNRTSSAVVITAPEENFDHSGADMTCFED